jgi:hypothetical protein
MVKRGETDQGVRSSRWADGLGMQRDVLLARVQLLQDQHARSSQSVGRDGAEASPIADQKICGMHQGRSQSHGVSLSSTESTPQHTECSNCGGTDHGKVVADLRRRNRALDMEVCGVVWCGVVWCGVVWCECVVCRSVWSSGASWVS